MRSPEASATMVPLGTLRASPLMRSSTESLAAAGGSGYEDGVRHWRVGSFFAKTGGCWQLVIAVKP